MPRVNLCMVPDVLRICVSAHRNEKINLLMNVPHKI
jgi:hypothetical protein